MMININPIERIHYDPTKKEHRSALKTFLTSNKWTIFFKVDDHTTNLPYHIMVKTLLWYMTKDV